MGRLASGVRWLFAGFGFGIGFGLVGSAAALHIPGRVEKIPIYLFPFVTTIGWTGTKFLFLTLAGMAVIGGLVMAIVTWTKKTQVQ